MCVDQLPDSMMAIDPAEPGPPAVLIAVERPVPAPAPGEVLIRVRAAGVNRPDILQRKGGYAPPPGITSIPGLEAAGEIVAVGPGVDGAVIGTAVCALLAGGGYAEYAVAPLGQCLPKPERLSWAEAAALPEATFTVWVNVFERAYAQPGEVMLIHGGTSGIGTAAVQLANAFGISPIVTCGSAEKCRAALDLGAHHAINYKEEDFVARVKELTIGRGVDIILDMIGGDYLPRNVECLAEDGRLTLIAVQGGAKGEANLARVLMKRLTLTGSTLRARSIEFKSLVADELKRNVWPLIDSGEYRPVMDKTFALADAAAAHTRMEAGESIGKIVLLVG